MKKVEKNTNDYMQNIYGHGWDMQMDPDHGNEAYKTVADEYEEDADFQDATRGEEWGAGYITLDNTRWACVYEHYGFAFLVEVVE